MSPRSIRYHCDQPRRHLSITLNILWEGSDHDPVPAPFPLGGTLVDAVARPFEPMLLTSAKTIPSGDVWRHEPKIDGFRCSLQVEGGRLRVWSRGGHEWSSRLPELFGLCDAGDGLVLDAEMTVVTADGRADFELLSNRILRSRSNAAPTPPVNVYVFDLLRRDHNDLIAQPWEHRRVALEALDISAATDGRVRPVPYSTDGEALRVAMQQAQGEGLCHKLASSRYSPGKRSTAWRKRPSFAIRPGCPSLRGARQHPPNQPASWSSTPKVE
jgi:bifunctional non-homologous end joining protein LigD